MIGRSEWGQWQERMPDYPERFRRCVFCRTLVIDPSVRLERGLNLMQSTGHGSEARDVLSRPVPMVSCAAFCLILGLIVAGGLGIIKTIYISSGSIGCLADFSEKGV